jgi:hypothetical protein
LGVITRVRDLPLSVSVLFGGGEAPWSARRHTIRAVEDVGVPSGAWKAVVSSRAVVSSVGITEALVLLPAGCGCMRGTVFTAGTEWDGD